MSDSDDISTAEHAGQSECQVNKHRWRQRIWSSMVSPSVRLLIVRHLYHEAQRGLLSGRHEVRESPDCLRGIVSTTIYEQAEVHESETD